MDKIKGIASGVVTATTLSDIDFFYESQTHRDVGHPEPSFEFLHATFGEFLVARFIVSTMKALIEDSIYQSGRAQPSALDVGTFYSATSFGTVVRSVPVREFCLGMLDKMDHATRSAGLGLLADLYTQAGYPHPTCSLTAYEPEKFTLSARYAIFTANLIVLSVLLAGGKLESEKFFRDASVDAMSSWRRAALLWESQLPREDWNSLWRSLRLSYAGGRPELCVEDNSEVSLEVSLPRPPSREIGVFADLLVSAVSSLGECVRRAGFLRDYDLGETFENLAPYWRQAGGMPPSADAALSDRWRKKSRYAGPAARSDGQARPRRSCAR